LLGFQDVGVRKIEFVAKTQILCFLLEAHHRIAKQSFPWNFQESYSETFNNEYIGRIYQMSS